VDTVSPSVRSRIMASVRAAGNKSTECAVVSILRKERITGWRRNYPLFGKPDFVFPHKGIALFIDGCLWHGCPQHCRVPLTNRHYWIGKISRNKARDIRNKKALQTNGWIVFRIWEHEIKTGSIMRTLHKIKKARSARRPRLRRE
jgi:DNA mismatch endonuclease (patch repair protein)